MTSRHKEHIREQSLAGVVSLLNQQQLAELENQLRSILEGESQQLQNQGRALSKAIEEITFIRLKLGSPENILGSDKTKHGEIAELVEVGIRNAKRQVELLTPNAKLLCEGAARTGPVDYLIDGVEVQSKFVNGARNSLDHVIKHFNENLENYPQFSQNGGYYHIPKDQFEIISKVARGETVEGVSRRQAETLIAKFHQIEESTGRPFNDVVRPGLSDYSEVQQGKVHATLDGHESDLRQRSGEREGDIRKSADGDRASAEKAAAPSLHGAAKAGFIGAALGGTLSLGFAIYRKHQEGRSVFEYHQNDWKDVGVDFGKGALRGGISGVALYGMTNLAKMPAPFAGAFVTSAFGVASLSQSFIAGEIDADEFAEQGNILCFETGVVALGATAGQTLIPIPVVGALVGTLVSKTLMDLSKNYLGGKTKEIQMHLESQFIENLRLIDKSTEQMIQRITDQYELLGGITAMAFDLEANVQYRLSMSVRLAQAHGVQHSKILCNTTDVDDFILS